MSKIGPKAGNKLLNSGINQLTICDFVSNSRTVFDLYSLKIEQRLTLNYQCTHKSSFHNNVWKLKIF